LHSGAKVTLVLRPAQPGTGIVFRRVDLDPPVDLKADALSVGDTRMASCLESRRCPDFATVEHLMSALSGLGIDNLYIDVDAAGTAHHGWLRCALCLSPAVGRNSGTERSQTIPPCAANRLRSGTATNGPNSYPMTGSASASPSSSTILRSTERRVRSARRFWQINSYLREVSRARTFGFTQDVEALRDQGLALGGSLENAIVMDEYRVLNAEGLRYADEFVKHKVLDAVGDLYLVGYPLLAAFSAHKSGHALNNRLLRALLADVSAWQFASFQSAEEAPGTVARLYPQLI
jgi:UDP-3-O-[3-hydroxymyristoyl] N-acetylglucosamine deacetylase